MKKIVCITSSSFIDTDFYSVRNLATIYKIEWFIFHKKGEILEYESEIKKLKTDKITINIINTLEHDRMVGNVIVYYKLCKKIKSITCDAILLSVSNAPYFIPVFYYTLKKVDNVIMGIHNVHAPKGAKYNFINRKYTEFAIKRFKNFQTYSASQQKLLKKIKMDSNVLYTPFFLKDFGICYNVRFDRRITFLNFGNIRDYKRIDVLIESAEIAYSKTGILFRVIIAGKCDSWEKYQQLIKTPELFDIRLGRVNNEDIADLFNECDFFVAPYQDIAQSGSAIVALNYEKPIIASNLEAFKEYVIDNITGYIIKPADKEDLINVMVSILNNSDSIIDDLKNNIQQLKKDMYSDRSIVRKYEEFIDGICQHQN